jgi:hypothetical protein
VDGRSQTHTFGVFGQYSGKIAAEIAAKMKRKTPENKGN